MLHRAQERHSHIWVETDLLEILQVKPGSWPHLVKQGGLEVLPRFSVHERVMKTAPLLRQNFCISLLEVPTVSTSPKAAKSRMA